ncbi:MAG TPA: VWA domain-containing protein [Terracidiphilus sp.]|nr:VWA domain-containing protein [Terracidiphilus sp.]
MSCALALLLAPAGAWTARAQVSGRPLQFPSHEAEEQREANRVQQDKRTVFHVEVRRVPVDVVVLDKDGKPVTGLKKGDFEVKEDGKKQKVLTFDYENGETPSFVPPKLPRMPPNTFVNLPKGPEAGPLYVLYYDMVNTLREHQMAFRQQLLSFVDHAPAGTRFALFVNAAGLHMVMGFTSDHEALREAILRDGPGPHVPKVFLGGATEFGPGEYGAGNTGAALSNLNFLAEYLGGIAGRKNVIWLADMFPIAIGPGPDGAFDNDRNVEESGEIEKTYASLMSSQISLYPVDLAGVEGGIAHMAKYQNESAIGTATGGHAYFSSNNAEDLIEKAVTHGESYYALSYEPSDLKFDGSERRIEVALKKKGHYTLSYRRFYFARPESAAKVAGREEILQARFVAAKDADTLYANIEHGAPMLHDVLFSVHLEAVGQAEMATAGQMDQLEDSPIYFKTRKRKKSAKALKPVKLEKYKIQYGVLDTDLKARARDEKKVPKLEFAAAAYDADGELLNSMLNDGLASPEPDANGKFGVLFHAEQELEVPPGAAWLRVAVRDEVNDRTGTLEIPLPLKPVPPEAAAKSSGN